MEVLTGFGLAAPAGLNAWLTLLMVALADRFTGLIDLPGDYDWLATWPAIIALTVLLVVEEIVDKIPGVDHINDAVQTAIRPTAGAIVMLAATQGDLPPAVGAVIGLLLAGAAHATKAAARPVVTVGTAGTGNPVVSVVEDVIAAASVVLALIAPLLAVLVLIVLFALAFRVIRRARRRSKRRDGVGPPHAPAPEG